MESDQRNGLQFVGSKVSAEGSRGFEGLNNEIIHCHHPRRHYRHTLFISERSVGLGGTVPFNLRKAKSEHGQIGGPAKF